eukprot:GHUV01040200.1.p1 GENE.GHUV01040200.1~~GHUV01040200.1.p1  ORF type:complete len:166 (+),score=49.58 GHUV01040200.1:2048-2545(+)
MHSLQIITERFTTPGWQVLEHLSGGCRRLDQWRKLIHDFALNIIKQRRKQLAAAAAVHSTGAEAVEPSALVQDARNTGTPGRDLLSLFLESTGPDGKPLTDQQLVDTVLNFIIAGRDTTAQVRDNSCIKVQCMHVGPAVFDGVCITSANTAATPYPGYSSATRRP